MTRHDDERLRRLLGGADTAWLVERLHRRLLRGEALTGTIALTRPSPTQRHAIEQLLGRPPGRGVSLTVTLDDLDTVIRRSGIHPDGLTAAIEHLTGPVIPLAEVARAEHDAWKLALTPLATTVRTRPELEPWFADTATIRLIRRLGGEPDTATALLRQLAAVLDALPCTTPTPLSRLASSTAGNAHALDRGQALATLVLHAVEATWGSTRTAVPASGGAARRRALWDSVGILVDELSSTVLVLNLRAQPGTYLHSIVEAARASGEPLLLTLRQLARHRLHTVPGTVFVCENPTLLAEAADRLGPDSHCLICLNGQPSIAATRLLEQLHHDGSTVRYHGDYDWGGIRIANLLAARLPWEPWRYNTLAYETAVTAHKGSNLTGQPVTAAWDPALRPALEHHQTRIEEEHVTDQLLPDLRM